MSLARSFISLCLVAACSGPSKPPVTPVEEPPVDAAAADAEVTTAPPDAAVKIVLDLPQKPPDAPPVIKPACRGAKLDLRKLVESEACLSPKTTSRDLPADIAISLEPGPLKIKSGAQKAAAIVLKNAGTSDATLVFDHSCGRILEVTYEMLASDGTRVDLDEGGCGEGRGCGPRTSAFQLPPNGELRLDYTLVARAEKFDDTCKATRVKPVPKGTYDFKLYSNIAPDQTAKITIE